MFKDGKIFPKKGTDGKGIFNPLLFLSFFLFSCSPGFVIYAPPPFSGIDKSPILIGPILPLPDSETSLHLFLPYLEKKLQERKGVPPYTLIKEGNYLTTLEIFLSRDYKRWVYGYLYGDENESSTGAFGRSLPTLSIWFFSGEKTKNGIQWKSGRITVEGERWWNAKGFSLKTLVEKGVDLWVETLFPSSYTDLPRKSFFIFSLKIPSHPLT